jgi:hypothetical protein
MRAQEFVRESVDADQVLQYVKRAHAPEKFDIEYSITDHPRWELKKIPVSQLKLDPEGEHQDPYNRVNWVDYDKVQELMPQITSVLKTMPIVVDSQGWIIDGNHRATAAVEAGLKSVPAYVPVSIKENFADGKNPGRKGLSRRVGIPKKATLGQLEKIAKSSSGERRRMAQWQLNMRRGKQKKNK